MTFTEASNAAFSIQSFDATEWDTGFSGGQLITVTGTFAGGGTINTSFTTASRLAGTTPTFQTFTFGAGWQNLANVKILQADGRMALDNVQVNAPLTPVPAPAGIVLMAFGAVGVVGYVRRHKPKLVAA